MNKKLFLGMFAAAGMLFATSCSNDELDVVQSGDEAQVTFSLGLEGGIATRAISDGTGAKKLVYAVYKLNANGIPFLQKVVGSNNDGQFVDLEAFDGGLTETVSVTLAKGQTYQVAFWAQNPICNAYTTTDLTNVKVDYEDAANNNDDRDAFFKTVEFTVNGNQTIDVELKRPFAQINVENGIVESDGITTRGEKVEIHPYSGKVIKGFKIPHWDKIKNVCMEAAKKESDIYFAGWDVCINKNGNIELIEANHAPDFDLMQSPLKIGIRNKLNCVLKEFFHCDLNNYFYKWQ